MGDRIHQAARGSDSSRRQHSRRHGAGVESCVNLVDFGGDNDDYYRIERQVSGWWLQRLWSQKG